MRVGEVAGNLRLVDAFTEPLKRAAASIGDFVTNIDKANKKVSSFGDKQTETSRRVVSETDKIRNAYNKLSAQLDPVVAKTQKYDKAVQTLNNALSRGIITQSTYNAQLAKAQSQLTTTEHWTSRLGKSIGSELNSNLTRFIAIGAIVTTVGAAITSTFKQLVTATIEAEAVQRKVESAVARSGNASGITSIEILKLADNFSRLTGIDDELIASAEVVALRFNRIGREIFPQVIQAALDMSAATGEDLTASMEKVGRIVNQPLRGLTLLNREGYAVGASQSDLVKHLLATNDILGAQNQMLEILKSQYGDAASAARDTLGGSLQALRTNWENLLEAIGEDSTGAIRDSIERLNVLLISMTDHVDDAAIGWNQLIIILDTADIAFIKLQSRISKIIPTLAAISPGIGSILAFSQARGNGSKDIAALESDIARRGEAITRLMLGLDKVTKGHNRATGAAREQTEAERKLSDAYNNLHRSLVDIESDIGKLLDEALDQANLYNAAKKSLEAYNEELIRQKVVHAIIAEENKLREATKGKITELTALQKHQIEVAIRGENEFRDKLKTRLEFLNKIQQALKNLSISNLYDFSKIEKISRMEIGVTIDATINEEFDSNWQEFTNTIRDGLTTDKAALEEYRQKVIAASQLQDSLGNKFLDTVEAEKELWRVREIQINQSLDDWGTFFAFLGDKFGGFFRQVSDGISRIQGAWQAGSKLDASGFGGGMGMSGSWGAIFAEVQIFYEAYMAVSRNIERKRRHVFGTLTSMQVVGGEWSSPSYFDAAGRAFDRSMRALLHSIEASLGSFITEMDQIAIRARKDGKEFSAYVGGVFVGIFTDAQQAMNEAVAFAITHAKFSNLGPLLTATLNASIGASLEELQSNIDFAARLATQNLPDIVRRMAEETNLAVADMHRAMELYANDLTALSLAGTSIITRFSDSLTALYNELMGIKEDPKAAWERMKASYNAQRAIMIAQITLLYEEIKARIALYQAQRLTIQGFLGGGGMGGGYGTGTPGEDRRLTPGPDRDPNNPLKGGQQQQGSGSDSRNPTNDPQLGALLALLDELGRALAGLPPAISGDMPKGWRTGGGGGGGRGEARSFVADKRFELSLRGLTDYRKSIVELDKQYDEQLKKAGKDKKLRAELLALKDQELKQLEDEKKKSTLEDYKQFLGLMTPFDEIRKTAGDLVKTINDSPFGSARKAKLIKDVLDGLEKQVKRMSMERASSLFSEMLADAEKFGLQEKDIIEARKSMALLEHQLKLIHYQEEITLLKTKGTIDKAIIDQLESLYGNLSKIDPTKFIGGSGTNAPSDPEADKWAAYWDQREEAFKRFTEQVKEATDLLEKYRLDGQDPFQRRLTEINNDFKKITSVLGNTADILAIKNRALQDALTDFLQPIVDFRKGMDIGEGSTLTGEQQFFSIQSQFRRLSTSATITEADRDRLLSLADTYRNIGRDYTAGEGYRFIDAEIKAALDRFSLNATNAVSQLGSVTNPMSTQSPALQKAVETGNAMMLSEMRNQTGNLKSMDATLASLDNRLANPLTFRSVA